MNQVSGVADAGGGRDFELETSWFQQREIRNSRGSPARCAAQVA